MLSEKNFQRSLCIWRDSCEQGVPSFLGAATRSERRSREKPRGKMYPTVLAAPPPKQYRQHSHSNPASYSGHFQQNFMNYTVLEKNWYFFSFVFSRVVLS